MVFHIGFHIWATTFRRGARATLTFYTKASFWVFLVSTHFGQSCQQAIAFDFWAPKSHGQLRRWLTGSPCCWPTSPPARRARSFSVGGGRRDQMCVEGRTQIGGGSWNRVCVSVFFPAISREAPFEVTK